MGLPYCAFDKHFTFKGLFIIYCFGVNSMTEEESYCQLIIINNNYYWLSLHLKGRGHNQSVSNFGLFFTFYFCSDLPNFGM